MYEQNPGRPVVAIIGGGVSGAGVAYHLALSGAVDPGHLFVFEPRARLGGGLAYDTADPAHRINVPAEKMSLLPDDPEHFLRWIEATDALSFDKDDEALAETGHIFPHRGLFGRYMNAMVHPLVEEGRITHIAHRAVDVIRRNDRWLVRAEDGQQLEADILVVATSHPSPTPPRAIAAMLDGHPRFVADPTRPDALDVIRPQDRVLIVGNGLTSADVIASLALRVHTGPITAISRRGLRSRGHARVTQELFGDFTSAPAKSALELLKRVRATIAEAAAEGWTWHAVIDQVRTQGRLVWQALPLGERSRLVRHLRPYWDVHRFRIAPQVEEASERAIRSGQLEVLAASVESVARDGSEIASTLRLSHAGGRIERRFDAVVVTTGPGHRAILDSQAWIAKLSHEGYLALDPTGLGLACDTRSQALGPDGKVAPSLYISGPLARGTFGELMGLPQVAEHALFVAGQILDDLSDAGRSAGIRTGVA